MHLNPERWLSLSAHSRSAIWLTIALGCAALAWLLAVRPCIHEQTQRLAEIRAQQQSRSQLWADVMPLRQAEELATSAILPERAFSALAFQTGSARLLSWHPNARGGELVLQTGWQDVPETFALLAKQRMQATAFSLALKEGVLHLRLELESSDGS
ncbi:hypothetical protein [Pseudescherichia sp.]|uniref:HofO family protein n=1 Tax=Pseudescherichia sp. TaxID=2055881 RepID=UPI00289BAC0D|nr:hypothetical protein [Pseudescherichia sp.]